MYRVEKSKDYNKSGEALSILDLQRLRSYITSTTPIESLTIQRLSQRNICFFELKHPKVIDSKKCSFEEKTQPFRNIGQRTKAGCTNKSKFNWIFIKLPNCTKKQETRATLYTLKIMSLVKKKMKFRNIRLGKIGDHISTNKRIKPWTWGYSLTTKRILNSFDS